MNDSPTRPSLGSASRCWPFGDRAPRVLGELRAAPVLRRLPRRRPDLGRGRRPVQRAPRARRRRAQPRAPRRRDVRVRDALGAARAGHRRRVPRRTACSTWGTTCGISTSTTPPTRSRASAVCSWCPVVAAGAARRDNAGISHPLFTFEHIRVDGPHGPLLTDVDGGVPTRGVTVVVGPSGAGKSTLLRLCNRLEVPTTGRVRFRGDDVAGLDPLHLRRRVGMVFQRPTPFAGTVRDNLRRRRARARRRRPRPTRSSGRSSTRASSTVRRTSSRAARPSASASPARS